MKINLASSPPTTVDIAREARLTWLRMIAFFIAPFALAFFSEHSPYWVRAVLGLVALGCLLYATFEFLSYVVRKPYGPVPAARTPEVLDMANRSIVIKHYLGAVHAQQRALTRIEFKALKHQLRLEKNAASTV